ncbi:MAG: 2OG-Fe(II) oxygenase [Hyphomonadaceae bacterium]
MSTADVTSLQQRASAGDARAQYELGARLLVGRGVPASPRDGARLVAMSAMQENTDALQLSAVLAAAGIGGAQNWSAAFEFVRRAAAQGDARAKAQLLLVGDELGDQLSIPNAVQHFDAPRVLSFERFLPPSICNWIVERAKPRLQAARVIHAEEGGRKVNSIRTNTGMGFSLIDTDLVMQLTQARIAAAIGQPMAHQEPTNILHYEAGQEYRPHYDFIDPGVSHFQQELMTVGQRTATFLIYLNEEYEGGATTFPRLDWSFRGKTGDALAFWNLTDGNPDARTLHAGTPTTGGIKWLFSKWVRDRPVPLI